MKIIIFVILTLFANDFNASKPRTFLCGTGGDKGIHECKSTDECIKIWNNNKWKIGYIEVVDKNGECEASDVPTVCCKNLKYVEQTYSASSAEILRPPECDGTCVSPSICKTPIPSNACSTTEVCCLETATDITNETGEETEEDGEGNDIAEPNQNSILNHCDGTCVPLSRCRIDIKPNFGCPDSYACCDAKDIATENETPRPQMWPDIQCGCFPQNKCDTPPVEKNMCDNDTVLCCRYEKNSNGSNMAEDTNMGGMFGGHPGQTQQANTEECDGACIPGPKCNTTATSNIKCSIASDVCCQFKDILRRDNQFQDSKKKCRCVPEIRCNDTNPLYDVCDNLEVLCCEVPKGNSQGVEYEEGYMKGKCITDNGDLRECVPHYLCLDKRKQSSCNCELQELCCESPRFK